MKILMIKKLARLVNTEEKHALGMQNEKRKKIYLLVITRNISPVQLLSHEKLDQFPGYRMKNRFGSAVIASKSARFNNYHSERGNMTLSDH